MRWPWRRRREACMEAALARSESEAKLRAEKARSRRVTEVADRLREIRERNQFAEMMDRAFRSAR